MPGAEKTKKIQQLPRCQVLQSHLSAIKQAGLFELPLKVKLDLYGPRHCGDMMMDYFEAADMTDLGLLQKLCTKFRFWSEIAGQWIPKLMGFVTCISFASNMEMHFGYLTVNLYCNSFFWDVMENWRNG